MTNTVNADGSPRVHSTRSYVDLAGVRVALLNDMRDALAGSVGVAHHRSNAGDRGLEWRVTLDDGTKLYGLSGSLLRRV
jgi:hypothetical protein